MPAAEYLAPVLTIAGLPALIFMIMRSFPHAARSVVVLLAGIAAVMTRDEQRGKRCLEVLRVLRGRDRDNQPPSLP